MNKQADSSAVPDSATKNPVGSKKNLRRCIVQDASNSGAS
jgi:hypothetical protein